MSLRSTLTVFYTSQMEDIDIFLKTLNREYIQSRYKQKYNPMFFLPDDTYELE